MTVGLELVQWALWWMAEQRRQYILNMRKALYYLDRRIVMGLTWAIPTLPGSFGPQPKTPVWLTRRRDWRRNLRIANWTITETHTKLGPGY